MRWDIEKAVQFIKEGKFGYLEGLEYTEEEKALIEAILFVESRYNFETIDALTERKEELTRELVVLSRENQELNDVLERCLITLGVIRKNATELEEDVRSFFNKDAS